MGKQVFGFDHLPQGYWAAGAGPGDGLSSSCWALQFHELKPTMSFRANTNGCFACAGRGGIRFFNNVTVNTIGVTGMMAIPFSALFDGKVADRYTMGWRFSIERAVNTSWPLFSLSANTANPHAEADYGQLAAMHWLTSAVGTGENYFEILFDFSTRKMSSLFNGLVTNIIDIPAAITKANFLNYHWLIGRKGAQLTLPTTAEVEYFVLKDLITQSEVIGTDEPIVPLGPVLVKRCPVLSADGADWTASTGTIPAAINTAKSGNTGFLTPYAASGAQLGDLSLGYDLSALNDSDTIIAASFSGTAYRDANTANGGLVGKIVLDEDNTAPRAIIAAQATPARGSTIAHLDELPGDVKLTKNSLSRARLVLTPSEF